MIDERKAETARKIKGLTQPMPKANKTKITYEAGGRTWTDTPYKVDPNGDIYVESFGNPKKILRGDYEVVVEEQAQGQRKRTTTEQATEVNKNERIPPAEDYVRLDKKGKRVRPKPIVHVFRDLRKNIDKLSKTVGTLKYTKQPAPGRNAIGAYSPFYQTIAMKKVGDLDTTSHELGHAMDRAYGLRSDIPKDQYNDIWKELEPFSKHGSTPPPGHPNPHDYELGEGIAEWVRAYLVNPKAAKKAAPKFYQHYQNVITPEAHKVMEQFSEDMRVLMGASGFEIYNASVEIIPEKSWRERWEKTKDFFLEALKPGARNPVHFEVTWGDRLRQKFTDSMQPWNATIKFAATVGNIDLKKVLPSKNPLIMARLFLGRLGKIDNFFKKGLVNAKSIERIEDPVTGDHLTIDWLLEPYDNQDRATFEAEQREMFGYALALRNKELPIKNVENQIRAALKEGKIIPSQILYSNKRLYDKFFEQNEELRKKIYENNDKYNEDLKDLAKKTEAKINKAYSDKRTKLEAIKDKQESDINAKRQNIYDQKGKISPKKYREKLRIFEQQATEAREAFDKEIDKLETERFKALQKLQGRIDGEMNRVLKESVIASVKYPHGQAFTGAGANLITEERLANKTLAQFEKFSKDKQDRIKEALRRYRMFADKILRYAVDSGRLSEESYKAIRENNEEYFMLQRVIQSEPGETFESPSVNKSKAIANVTEVLYSIKGSSETIRLPYNALLQFANRTIVESDRNQVMKSYVDFMQEAIEQAGKDKNQGRISGIISPAVKEDKNTIKVFRNGQEQYFHVDQDILDSMKAVTSQLYSLPKSAWFLTFMPKLLRTAITNNPVFAARNKLRDYQTMLVVSDNIRGIKDIVPRKKLKLNNIEGKDAFDVFGADQGGYHLLSEDFYNQTLEKVSAKLAGKKGNILVRAQDFAKLATKSVHDLSSMSEKSTRMQEFKNAGIGGVFVHPRPGLITEYLSDESS